MSNDAADGALEDRLRWFMRERVMVSVLVAPNAQWHEGLVTSVDSGVVEVTESPALQRPMRWSFRLASISALADVAGVACPDELPRTHEDIADELLRSVRAVRKVLSRAVSDGSIAADVSHELIEALHPAAWENA